MLIIQGQHICYGEDAMLGIMSSLAIVLLCVMLVFNQEDKKGVLASITGERFSDHSSESTLIWLRDFCPVSV